MARHRVWVPQRLFVISISLNNEVVARDVGVGQVRAVILIVGLLGRIAPWKLVVQGGDVYQGLAEQKNTPEEDSYGEDDKGNVCNVSATACWRYQAHLYWAAIRYRAAIRRLRR